MAKKKEKPYTGPGYTPSLGNTQPNLQVISPETQALIDLSRIQHPVANNFQSLYSNNATSGVPAGTWVETSITLAPAFFFKENIYATVNGPADGTMELYFNDLLIAEYSNSGVGGALTIDNPYFVESITTSTATIRVRARSNAGNYVVSGAGLKLYIKGFTI